MNEKRDQTRPARDIVVRASVVDERSKRGKASSREQLLEAIHLTKGEAEAIIVALAAASQEQAVDVGAARTAMTKIVAASPAALRERLARAAASAMRPQPIADRNQLVGVLKRAIRDERELRILYSDQAAEDSVRTIKPLALADSRKGRSIAAWCNLRGDFRHFRLDRIVGLTPLESFFKGEREVLLDRYMDEAPG